MKIAFISLNQEKLPDPVIPIGLLYLMANTPKRHETVLWDLCFESDPLKALQDHISTFQPDLIALGLRNIQNSIYSGMEELLSYYKSILSLIRKLSPSPVILGGSGFSVMPKDLMKALGAEYGISGEGEIAFPAFLEALESKSKDFSRVPNLHYWSDGGILSNPAPERFLDLNELQSPDLRKALPRYIEETGTGSVQTKRGCPLECSYCTYPVIEGKTKRLRHPENIVKEMQESIRRQPGLSHFFIVDSVFNLPTAHAKDVCREMIRRGFSTPWTPYVNPLGFDEELAHLMAEAGCAGLEIGSDSGVDRVLDQLKKGFHAEDILKLSQIAKGVGLKDCHSFIFGTPGETIDEVRQSLDFITRMDPYCAILGIWVDDHEALDASLAPRRKEFRDQLRAVLGQFAHAHPFCVIPAMKVQYQEKVFSFLRRRQMKGPLWQMIRQQTNQTEDSLWTKKQHL